MFTQIKTSKENKEIVAKLTRKLNLGTENIIARIAFSHSLSLDRKLSLNDLADYGGKEYTRSVLFGEYEDIYIGLICVNYNIYKTDKDLAKYVKLHVDDGLKLLDEDLQKNTNMDGFDYLVEKVSTNMHHFSI